jgi:hypothetical protein
MQKLDLHEPSDANEAGRCGFVCYEQTCPSMSVFRSTCKHTIRNPQPSLGIKAALLFAERKSAHLGKEDSSLGASEGLSKRYPVYKDIRFTRRIGTRYLWIDSLCIIQDSQTDWTHEAASMSTVYANGVCNLAATGFIDGTMGLFAPRQPSLLQPILVNFNNEIYFDEGLTFRRGQYFLVEANSWKEDIEDAPLNQRGWVM